MGFRENQQVMVSLEMVMYIRGGRFSFFFIEIENQIKQKKIQFIYLFFLKHDFFAHIYQIRALHTYQIKKNKKKNRPLLCICHHRNGSISQNCKLDIFNQVKNVVFISEMTFQHTITLKHGPYTEVHF